MKNQTLKNIIKESITDYLSELNSINEDSDVPAGSGISPASKDMALDMMKNPLPTQTKESLTSTPGLMFEDKVTKLENNISKDGKIYLVRKPTKDTGEGGIVEEKSLSELIGDGYIGVFTSGEKALAFGKKALKQRDLELKENIKKGHEKIGGLEKQVADLKAEMAKLIDNPEMRGELLNYTAKLEKAEQVLEKLKVAIEKSSPKKEKKEKKDDE